MSGLPVGLVFAKIVEQILPYTNSNLIDIPYLLYKWVLMAEKLWYIFPLCLGSMEVRILDREFEETFSV
jgi:hypothetical protein